VNESELAVVRRVSARERREARRLRRSYVASASVRTLDALA
jgi:hypothetical protein